MPGPYFVVSRTTSFANRKFPAPASLRYSMRHLIVAALLAALTVSATASAAPPKLPDPTYQSVSKDVLVPMDDGVKIAMTVAWPSKDGSTPAPGKFPAVLEMTPYGRQGVCGCD